MSEVDSLILVMLRKLQSDMDLVRDDLSNIKIRVTYVEENMVGIHRRLDNFDLRLDRIDRRLELVDG